MSQVAKTRMENGGWRMVKAPSAADALLHPQSSILRSRLRRVTRRIIARGWVHLLALTLIALFLFPFAYMVATSLKTDEELTDAAWLPVIPHFEGTSPRV